MGLFSELIQGEAGTADAILTGFILACTKIFEEIRISNDDINKTRGTINSIIGSPKIWAK